MSKRSVVVGVALVGALVLGATPALGAAYLPDALIAKRGGSFVGEDIYNTTGAGQNLLTKIKPGRKAVFDLGFENDGYTGYNFWVGGCESDKTFKVSYKGPGGVNLTSEFISGTFLLDTLTTGTTNYEEHVTIRATKRADKGDKKRCPIIITSDNSSIAQDKVLAKVRVK